jgi:hypothetical protein
VERIIAIMAYDARMNVAMAADSTEVIAFASVYRSTFWIETIRARVWGDRSLAEDMLDVEVVLICAWRW